MTVDMSDVLRSAYEIGGREPGRIIDCAGVAIIGARRFWGCGPDPWRAIRDAWERNQLQSSNGFPSCWFRLADGLAIANGDVLLFYGRHPWAAIVLNGHVYSAEAEVGPYCKPLARWTKKPAEIWRHDPTAHSQGAAR